MLDFQVPRITSETVEENRGSFTIEPLDRGFGYTFGNSLRRVLLCSLAGAAVTSVRIEGVAHEFSTIKGVTEDVTDIVLNLKGIVCRMHSDATEVEAPLVVTGPGEITAKDIDLPAGVEILNPDVHIATLEKKTKLELYLTIGRGRGYRPAEDNKSPDQPIGVIPIDSIFSPVRRVAYAVEQARVGQRTDYDKLTLDIETDGSIDPQAALREAAEILIAQLAIFTDADRIEELRAGPGGQLEGANGASAPGGAGGPAARRPARCTTSSSRSSSSACGPTTASSAPASRPSATSSRSPRASSTRSRTSARSRSTRSSRRSTPAAWTCATTEPARIPIRSCATRRHATSSAAAPSHRKALLMNLCKEVIEHERIKTTEAKAKAVKPEIEQLITLAKRGDLHARRQALSDARAGQVRRPQAVRGGRAALRGAPRRLHAHPEARPASERLDRDGLPRARLSVGLSRWRAAIDRAPQRSERLHPRSARARRRLARDDEPDAARVRRDGVRRLGAPARAADRAGGGRAGAADDPARGRWR